MRRASMRRQERELRATVERGDGSLTAEQARELAAELHDAARMCSASVEGEFIVFAGPTGRHSVCYSVSNEERVRLHWLGFLEGARKATKLVTCRVSQREAFTFVAERHRHHKPPRGAVFAVGVRDRDGQLRGVAVVGRPVARRLDTGEVAEVTRLCTDGAPNACSSLYAAARKAAAALGFRRLITYTLPDEGGGSLRASGFKLDGHAGGGSWSRRGRARVDQHPTARKLRWSAPLAA